MQQHDPRAVGGTTAPKSVEAAWPVEAVNRALAESDYYNAPQHVLHTLDLLEADGGALGIQADRAMHVDVLVVCLLEYAKRRAKQKREEATTRQHKRGLFKN